MCHHDCLIWVGQSYPTISDFLDEARTRGCCRKVPFWPAWARPGETRIFLAHHDGQTSSDRGTIFGYFKLWGVDIVLLPGDYQELSEILSAWREAQGEAHRDGDAGRRCAEQMTEFWRRRAPDDPLPFKLRDSKGDLEELIPVWIELFLSSADGDALGSSAFPIPTTRSGLEKPRFCPVDGMRTAPNRSRRPSFYFVDPLARLVDRSFEELVEEELTELRVENGASTREESLARLAELAAAPDENGRPSGLPHYREAMARAGRYLEHHDQLLPKLGVNERRCGTMNLFKSPYPFYKSIPHASFRGLVQIDGDDLLRQIQRPSRRRAKSHEVKLPYVVEASDRHTSKRKDELIVEMSMELKLSKSYSERVLDWLPEMMADELRSRRMVRLPNIGTFRVKERDPAADGDVEETIEYTPARSFQREFGEIEFTASRGLDRRG